MDPDRLIGEYLQRLTVAASDLPSDRSAELLSEVRDHIDAAISVAGGRDESTVRNILERLGPAEEIVSAEWVASDGSAASAVREAAQRGSWGALEIAALLMLVVGGVLLPFVGPLIGLVLVWLSSQWTTREKSIATGITLVLLVVPFVLTAALVMGTGAAGGDGGLIGSPVPVYPPE